MAPPAQSDDDPIDDPRLDPTNRDGDSDDGGSITLSALGISWITVLKPYVGTLTSFASSPTRFIRTRVAAFVTGGAIGLTFEIARPIGQSFAAVESSINQLGDIVVGAFVEPGAQLLSVIGTLTNPIVTLARDTGPVGWIIGTVLLVLLARILVDQLRRVALGILDAVPTVGSALESYLR